MKITKEMANHISALSRLRLSESESTQIAAELEKIVTCFNILSQLPTRGVEPTSHILPVKNVLREDEAFPSQARRQLLANSPTPDPEVFLVPKTVE